MKKLKISLCIFLLILIISMPTFAIYMAYTIGNNKAEFNLTIGVSSDVTIANAPKVANGMIPVIWSQEDNSWKVVSTANTDYEWYSYNEGYWANVMMSDGKYIAPNIATDVNTDGKDDVTDQTLATEGILITEEDLGSFFVWIPRYEYKITDKAINVKFLTADATNTVGYTTHPAFTNEFTDDSDDTNDFTNGGWDKELDGFWASKFQASKATDESIKILPNKTSWNSISVQDAYTTAMNENYGIIEETDIANLNSHLMKNSEWGAVGYLSWSKYALNGKRMYINNYIVRDATSATTITGASGSAVDATPTTAVYGTYENEKGIKASTTGNITGIYDMNGCLTEYTASCLAGAPLLNGGSSTKYVMSYSTAGETKIGDAVSETSGWENCTHIAITNTAKYFMRGEPATAGNYAASGKAGGQFAYNSSDGAATSLRSFRTVLVVE